MQLWGLGVVGRNGPTSSTTITGTDAEGSDCAREVSVVLYIVLYIALRHRVLLHIVILYCILHCFILYSVRGGAELRWALSYLVFVFPVFLNERQKHSVFGVFHDPLQCF